MDARFGMLGRLLNEYLVDMFSSVEDSRLNYIRHEVQNRIAAQSELNETIEAEGGVHAGRVYLPGVSEDVAEFDHGWPSHCEETWEAHLLLDSHLQSQLARDQEPPWDERPGGKRPTQCHLLSISPEIEENTGCRVTGSIGQQDLLASHRAEEGPASCPSYPPCGGRDGPTTSIK